MKTFLTLIMLLVISTATYASPVSLKYNDHTRSVMLDRFEGVKDHLFEASQVTGIDMAELTAIASLESKLVGNVRNPHGTASGMLQYTNGTWKHKRKMYAKELGLSPNAHQFNVRANLLIGSKDLQETKESLVKRTHLDYDTLRLGDVYMSHFLGEDAAVRLINSYSHKPINKIVKINAGNYRYYYKPNGKIRTAREFRQFMNKIATDELKVYQAEISKYQLVKFFEPFQGLMDTLTDAHQRVAMVARNSSNNFG